MLRVFITLILAAAVFFIIVMVIDNNRFVVRKYSVRSPKIKKPLKIVFIADLHEKCYRNGNEELIGRIRELAPDMILIGGDLIVSVNVVRDAKKSEKAGRTGEGTGAGDRKWMKTSESFIRSISDICPVRFVKGNHELRLDYYEEYREYGESFRAAMESAGVRMMGNGFEDIDTSILRGYEDGPFERMEERDTGIRICGLELPMTYYKKFRKTALYGETLTQLIGDADRGRFNVLLTHSPVYFEQYAEWGADLCLCGHVHGGLMRLPVIGGVVGTRPSLFPKYSGGQYFYSVPEGEKICFGTMVLTCGLGMHTLPIRIFNPGEISVIELKPSLMEGSANNRKQEAAWN